MIENVIYFGAPGNGGSVTLSVPCGLAGEVQGRRRKDSDIPEEARFPDDREHAFWDAGAVLRIFC